MDTCDSCGDNIENGIYCQQCYGCSNRKILAIQELLRRWKWQGDPNATIGEAINKIIMDIQPLLKL